MSLLVSILKAPDSVRVAVTSMPFSTEGGTIGRGAENTWSLDDPDLYLSSLHCQFLFDSGQYYLVDQSTNGTFYNGSSDPMGKGCRLPVSDKDQFIIGDYQFSIGVIDQTPTSAFPASSFSPSPPSTDNGFDSGPFNLGGSLNDSSMLSPHSVESDPLAALDKARGDAIVQGGMAVGHPADSFNSAMRSDAIDPLTQQLDWPEVVPAGENNGSVIPDDWDDGSEPISTSPPVIPQPSPQPSTPAVASVTSTDTTFIDALGLGNYNLSDTEIAHINQLGGEVLREMVGGVMQVLGSRSSIKNEFRMNVTTIQPVENNPLKFSANVDDALENMFLKRGNSYKQPVDAVREGFESVAEHQVAILAGIREAFKSVIARFDPVILEGRFARHNKGGLLPGSQKAKNWESFTAYYEELVGDVDKSFEHLFSASFVRAYEDQLQKLAIARKPKGKSHDVN